jgi:hypothetical protein
MNKENTLRLLHCREAATALLNILLFLHYIMSSAPMDHRHRATLKIAVGNMGKASLLQTFSLTNNARCSLDEIHAYSCRTRQPLRPVGMIPNRLHNSWVQSREEQSTKRLL